MLNTEFMCFNFGINRVTELLYILQMVHMVISKPYHWSVGLVSMVIDNKKSADVEFRGSERKIS